MIAALEAAGVRFVSTLESGRLSGAVRCGFAPAGQANGVVVQFRGRDNCAPKGDAHQPPSAPAFQRDPQPASSNAMPAPTTEGAGMALDTVLVFLSPAEREALTARRNAERAAARLYQLVELCKTGVEAAVSDADAGRARAALAKAQELLTCAERLSRAWDPRRPRASAPLS